MEGEVDEEGVVRFLLDHADGIVGHKVCGVLAVLVPRDDLVVAVPRDDVR